MPRQRTAAFLSIALTAGIIVAAILGPLVTGIITFHLPRSLIVQYEGGEVVTLAVAAPLLVFAGWLWLRGDRSAPALAFGPAVYAVYTFITAIVGQEYARYEGNAERAFLLYTGLIALGAVVAAISLNQLLQRDAPVPPDRLRIVMAATFLVIAGFFALAWLGQVAQVYRGEKSEEYLLGPTLFWLIKMLDLAFIVPALAIVGLGLLRSTTLAIRVAYGMVTYAVCMAWAVLGMGIAMWAQDDPAASMGMIAFLSPVTLALAYLAFRMQLAYRGSPPRKEHRRGSTTPFGTGHAR